MATQTSNTVRLADGTYRTEFYTVPINYRDGVGDWVPIDNALVPAPGAAYAVENAANSYTASIPEDPTVTPVRFETADAWVTSRMRGVLEDRGSGPNVDDAEATFDDYGVADSVTYEATAGGLKETITLAEPPEQAVEFKFDLQLSPGLQPTLRPDGSIEFREGDEVRFVVPIGNMQDSASPEPAFSTAVLYSLDRTQQGWLLKVVPDHSWLTSADRVYPVDIDPTLYQNPIRDTWLQQDTPNTSRYGGTYIQVGATSGSKRRGLLDFNISALPQDADVSYAALGLALDRTKTTSGTSADYALYHAGKQFGNGATWNNSNYAGSWVGGDPASTRGSNVLTLGGTGSPAQEYIYWDVTDFARHWSNRTWANGMVLKSVGEGSTRVLSFFSGSGPAAYRPVIGINYTLVPSAPVIAGVTPCVAPCWSSYLHTRSLTPTVKAIASDGDTAELDYTFQLANAETENVVATSGTIRRTQGQTASWPVPSGAITATSDLFEVRVTVSDGLHSLTSDWTALSASQPQAPEVADLSFVTPCDEPCEADETTSLEPAVAFAVADPEATVVDSRLELRSVGSTTSIYVSDWKTVANYEEVLHSVPTGLLTDGGDYEVRSITRNAAGLTSTSAWEALSVNQRGEAEEPGQFTVTPCTSPCDVLATTSETPTLTAKTDASENGSRSVLFEIWDGESLVASTETSPIAPGATASWQVPTGLIHDHTFELRVGTRGTDGIVQYAATEPLVGYSIATPSDEPAEEYQDPSSAASSEAPFGWDANSNVPATEEPEANRSGPTEFNAARAAATVTEPPQVRYAPLILLHPSEEHWPLDSDTFVRHSSLNWFHANPKRRGDTDCPETEPLARPVDEYLMSHWYYHFNGSPYSCGHDESALFWADDMVAPYMYGGPGYESNPNPKRQSPEGMYLDLDESARKGYGFAGDEEVYWHRSGRVLTYWFLYGNSRFPQPGFDIPSEHEGDWERIAIKLKRDGVTPLLVEYFQHFGSCIVPWDEVPRDGDHPVLQIAQETHASYPLGGDPAGVNEGVDIIGLPSASHLWDANERLRKITDEPWWGYSGSWGRTRNHNAAKSGPMSPSQQRWFSDTYGGKPRFKADPCQGLD